MSTEIRRHHGLSTDTWKALRWEAAHRGPQGGKNLQGLSILNRENDKNWQPLPIIKKDNALSKKEVAVDSHAKKETIKQHQEDQAATASPLSTSETNVSLQMFSAEASKAKNPLIRKYVKDSHFNWLVAASDPDQLARHEEKRKARYLASHKEVTPEAYDTMRKETLEKKTEAVKHKVNEGVYQTIQQQFRISDTDKAHDFYEKQRRNANNAITRHNELVAPGDISRMPRNEIELPKRPADLLEMYLSPNSDPVLKYEIKRQALLAHISGEIERNSAGGEEKLAQIQTLLDKNLYEGKAGSTQLLDVYAQFDSQTNRVLHIFEDKPANEAEEGSHYKLLKVPARKVQGMENLVLTQINTKSREAAINKALRKALKRANQSPTADPESRQDEVKPKEDVRDTDRMKLVVMGNEDAANELIDKVFDILSDKNNQKHLYDRDKTGKIIRDADGNPKGMPIDVIPDDEVNGDEGQSNNIKFRRILMPFNGLENPVEIIVQPFENYINDLLEVGTYGTDKPGEYSGNAHELYSIKRELWGITQVLFDKSIYPGIKYPYEQGTEIPHPTLEVKAKELLQRNIVDLKK